MNITFFKYQGTGNDFIMVNAVDKGITLEPLQIQRLCNRKFGIGADGIILIKADVKTDFYVDYYNPDGSQSFCGNGSRCAVAFAFAENVFEGKTCSFNAIDGTHKGEVLDIDNIEISMRDVEGVEEVDGDFVLDTGSPHFVRRCNALKELDIITEARKVRYNQRFSEQGINVNFISQNGSEIHMRTYERGVEDETLSCGTGVTAVALSSVSEDGVYARKIITKGGDLMVNFKKSGDLFQTIRLQGAAKFVFSGLVNLT
ncbi:MAG: diaminopimelate epimerase [Flavobacteriales bacterium]|jgi:diaminopimelate epimerase|tara:strand:+ start:5992 stop:6765 length:774 start_codon:yes stop_codon:yes gene_type:complete